MYSIMCKQSIVTDIYLCDHQLDQPAQLMLADGCGGCEIDTGEPAVNMGSTKKRVLCDDCQENMAWVQGEDGNRSSISIQRKHNSGAGFDTSSRDDCWFNTTSSLSLAHPVFLALFCEPGFYLLDTVAIQYNLTRLPPILLPHKCFVSATFPPSR